MRPIATLPTVALAAFVAGCSPPPQSGASNAPGVAAASGPETPYAAAVDQATRAVQAAGSGEALALAHLDRAQLTGSFDDYVAADRALPQASCLAAARVHAALHRLQQAAASVHACRERIGLNAAERAELDGIAADVAFHEGRYDEALRGYRAALRLDESVAGLARLSQYHGRTGAPVEAAALLDRAERLYHGDSARPLAWLALQRAQLALDTGRRDDALAHALRAQRLMPGWWLADEHVAEARALRGQFDVALREYEALAQRTAYPEHMDAIARILLEQRQPKAAAAWIARSRAIHRQRLAALPEAAAGHAVEHFLQFEPLEADELLAIAQRNVAARPGAEAQIYLAQAYLRLGRRGDAAAVLRPVLDSAWSTAKLHAVAAQVSAAGDS